MRPGPGLVVMALAFISGARRGSTSSISSKTTTTTTSSPPLPPTPPPPLTITTPTSSLQPASSPSLSQRSSTTASLASSYINTATAAAATTANSITTTSSPPLGLYEHFGLLSSRSNEEEAVTEDHHRNQHHHNQLHPQHRNHQHKEPLTFNFFNTFYSNNKFLQTSSSSLSSSVSRNTPYSLYSSGNKFAYTFPLSSHLTRHYDDPRIRSISNKVLPSVRQPRRATSKFRRRRKRRTRSANVNYKDSGAREAGDNLNESDDSTSQSTAVDSSSSSNRDSVINDLSLARGLPVHFPSLTAAAAAADSSRSFDEDDIFALVAEDDLLSEESFDRLVKLTDDKIGETNEEDYSSGTETVVSSSSSSSSSSTSGSGSGSGAAETQDTNHQNAIEDFERLQQSEDPSPTHGDTQQLSQPVQNSEPEPETPVSQNEQSEQSGPDRTRDDDAEPLYKAHLVSNVNDKVVSITDTEHIAPQGTSKAELKSLDRHRSILESDFPLTRLNPWISACDLAQPGLLSAPDLQGECSAGTLPVAWVDEGPGPPKCLKSCIKVVEEKKEEEIEEGTPFTHKLNKDNMINTNNNSNNNNNNNNNNNKHTNNTNDNKLTNKLVSYTTTTNTLNIKLRNSQPTISHSLPNNDNSNKNNNNKKESTDNNSGINKRVKQQRSQKLLNPFNYYQVHKNYNNNNNKMAKTRRNSKDNRQTSTSAAAAAVALGSHADSGNSVATSLSLSGTGLTSAAVAAAGATTPPFWLATGSNTTNNINNTTNILHATHTNSARDSDDDMYEFVHDMQQDAATAPHLQHRHPHHHDDVEGDSNDVENGDGGDDVMDDATDKDDDEDDVDDIDLNVHNDAAVADNAAFIMQLQQFQKLQQHQQPQNQANNNIVKMKTSSRAGGSSVIGLKYNHMKAENTINANSNNQNGNSYHTSTYQIQIEDPNTYMSNLAPGPLTKPPEAKNNTNTNTNNNSNSNNQTDLSQSQQQQQKKQKCLDYMGDSNETMPMHLCTQLNSPSHLIAQLRHLRLRNCCERNVYSALHTLALNATLGGGEQCVRILEDLMELDALASSITCGLAEILFRFDCRQVYSIIHRCEDCKEAYRRWVCSTLVPYFAEPSDVINPTKTNKTSTDSGLHHPLQQQPTDKSKRQPTIMLNSNKLPNYYTSTPNSSNNKNTTMASNMTTSHITTHNNNSNSSSSNINNSNSGSNNGSGMSIGLMTKAAGATSNFDTATMTDNNGNNNNNNNNYNDIQHLQQQLHQQQQQQHQQHHVKRRDVSQQHKHHKNTKQLNDKLNNNYIARDDSNTDKDMIHTIPATRPPARTTSSLSTASKSPTPPPTPPLSPSPSPSPSSSSSSRQTRALTFDDIIFLGSNSSATISFARGMRINNNVKVGGRTSVGSVAGLNAFGQNQHNKSTNNKRRRKRSIADETATSFFLSGSKTMQLQQQKDLLGQQQQLQQTDKVANQQQTQHTDKQEQQSFNFISTANNEDSLFVKDPVISKLLQRSKRRVEFRRRRRIRPCLSVCQTVEQKCPYLLPADRAPALPTQYAGEPTFLCLDYNIAETEEQLRKASHGPNDCCYTYCKTAADGICTYCNDFLATQDIELEAERLNKEQEKRIYNITLKARNQDAHEQSIRVETRIQQKLAGKEQEAHLKMSTVAIAVRNDSLAENVTRLAERLQYYAYCEGVYYYDDVVDDIPELAYSEDCIALPTLPNRCTIPYYASNYITSGEVWSAHRRHSEAQKLMVWLSTLLCLWSCYTARVLRMRRIQDRRHQHNQQQQLNDLQITEQQQQHEHKNNNNKNINTAFDRKLKQCKNCDEHHEIKQNAGKDFKKMVTVWYDVTENRILFIYYMTSQSPTITKERRRQRRHHDKATNGYGNGHGQGDGNVGGVRYRDGNHDRQCYIRLRGLRTLRNFHEIVRRSQQIDLLYGKNALILLIHYTNRLKAFMQRTQPHRKRKLTHLKWPPGRGSKWRRTLMQITINAMQQMIYNMKIMIMMQMQLKMRMKMKMKLKLRKKEKELEEEKKKNMNTNTRIMKNCSNVSFSPCSCSLTSCSCNHINNNYYNNNNKKNKNKKNNNINNNYYYNYNTKYMKKFKFNFSTCNFKNTNINNHKHNNKYNNNNNNNNSYNNNNKHNNNYYGYYHYYKQYNNNMNNNNKSNDTQQLVYKQQQFSIINLKYTTKWRFTTPPYRSIQILDWSCGLNEWTNLVHYLHPVKNTLKLSLIRSSSLTNSPITHTNLATFLQPHHQRHLLQIHQHEHLDHHILLRSDLYNIATMSRPYLFYIPHFQKLSYNSKINNYHNFYDFDFDTGDWWHRHFTPCRCRWRWCMVDGRCGCHTLGMRCNCWLRHCHCYHYPWCRHQNRNCWPSRGAATKKRKRKLHEQSLRSSNRLPSSSSSSIIIISYRRNVTIL